ncbi:MAG TPA: YraN family protein [Candidatus Baltobacteraceae bacterium]|jgi:putative endonuclease
MARDNGAKGRDCEARAASFLERSGYRVMQRNVRLPGGEIDLICQDGEILVFVEVKSRTTSRFGSAFSAVDARKRSKLRRLAADYVQIVAPNARVRFDVVAEDGDRMTLHRNAF